MKGKYFATMLILICLSFLFSRSVTATTREKEPNNSKSNAQSVVLGTEYTGAVEDAGGEDEDYYKLSVKEGRFYKISFYGLKDMDEYGWETMIVSLCKDSNTSDSKTISNGDYTSTNKLFRAAYTGYYYIRLWNTTNTKYSFKVQTYNPKGKKVKDSESNTYKITGNYTLEFAKIASKNKPGFYFSDKEYFSTIGGIEVLDDYNTQFTVTSIGNYAFKNSKIKSISIPKGIKRIGTGAFQNCKKLGTETYFMGVVIHGKNVVIGSKAFSGCKKLGTFRVLKSASIKAVKKNAFKGTKKGIRLEVPKVKKYKKLFKKAGLKKPIFKKAYL